ncbi:MAG: adenylate/guanylate cyclase domain-containing protein [Melioribacteraceae bacterium]|nr:adenylate/guanylate cyclase domain-containing protein [Melioribacteraceae bacterium]
MINGFNYTTRARAFALKHPKLSFILIQVNFWTAAFLLLITILHLNKLATLSSLSVDENFPFVFMIIYAVVAGLLYGVTLGFVDVAIEKYHNRNLSLGRIMFMQGITYYVLIIILMLFSRYVIWDLLLVQYLPPNLSMTLDHDVWRYYYWIVLIYTFAMAMVISFINQMNKKFGPGVLLPMLFGKYRNPQEEQRIFMFMDLKSSTSHAEKLGHLKYSALIRDSFIDINKVLVKHRAEVYQYVGDEIVVSWPQSNDLDGTTCVEFYFACQEQFDKRSEYYLEKYGIVPKFKAGLHQGIVTTVEVGDVKRDLAYHGDTINTTSRIQEKCNEYESDILVSETFWEKVKAPIKYQKNFVGEVLLKGKETPVRLFSVQFAGAS